MENLDMALSLLAIGMITVFIILWLVVIIGNAVIRFTNRFLPVAGTPWEALTAVRKTHPKKLAAIVSAVDVVTDGKGRVEKIEKK